MSKATAAQAESFGKENFAALLDESFGAAAPSKAPCSRAGSSRSRTTSP
jgi:hypothetical protein